MWKDACRPGFSEVCPLLPIRRRADLEGGRIHAWAKVAREGRLPPALALALPHVDQHLLVDGHARLAAAEAVGCPLPVLVLVAVHPGGRAQGDWRNPASDEVRLHRASRVAADVAAMGEAAPPAAIDALNRLVLEAAARAELPVVRASALPGGRAAWDAFHGAARRWAAEGGDGPASG